MMPAAVAIGMRGAQLRVVSSPSRTQQLGASRGRAKKSPKPCWGAPGSIGATARPGKAGPH